MINCCSLGYQESSLEKDAEKSDLVFVCLFTRRHFQNSRVARASEKQVPRASLGTNRTFSNSSHIEVLVASPAPILRNTFAHLSE